MHWCTLLFISKKTAVFLLSPPNYASEPTTAVACIPITSQVYDSFKKIPILWTIMKISQFQNITEKMDFLNVDVFILNVSDIKLGWILRLSVKKKQFKNLCPDGRNLRLSKFWKFRYLIFFVKFWCYQIQLT